MKKRMKQLHAELVAAGFTVEGTGGGHIKVYKPGQRGVVFMSATPSDGRAFKNALGDLRRELGFVPSCR